MYGSGGSDEGLAYSTRSPYERRSVGDSPRANGRLRAVAMGASGEQSRHDVHGSARAIVSARRHRHWWTPVHVRRKRGETSDFRHRVWRRTRALRGAVPDVAVLNVPAFARILRDYEEAGSLNGLLALWGFVDETTFLTKAGHVGVIYRVRGIDGEGLTHGQRGAVVHRFEAALRLLDERYRVYQYLVKRT